MASTATLLCSHVAPRSCATRTLEKSAFAGTSVLAIPALEIPGRASSSVKVRASGKKIKVADPWGPGGGANFPNGVDASGRKSKEKRTPGPPRRVAWAFHHLTSRGKGVYQFTNKYGANVDGYSPIYSPEEWSPSGDVYVGGTTGLLIWAITLAGILLGGALLVYNTSALVQ